MDPKRASAPAWPDKLSPPDPAHVQALLGDYWLTLHRLPDLLNRGELLLAEACTTRLRGIVIELMLALNGIAMPADTLHLNGYLGASQRAALERTLLAPAAESAALLGRAVALTVIYRWYAPQLVEKLHLLPARAEEESTWALLVAELADWPTSLTSE